ncbi:MAG: trypsin-like peptidase domain-containing protein [Polyangiaceae bacterium]
MPLSNEEAQAIVRENAELLRPHVVALQVLREDDPTPSGIATGGTGVLLEIDGNRLLLTAQHVLEALRRDHHVGILGGNDSAPASISSWQLIDEEKAIDIGTLSVPPGFDPTPLGKRFLTQFAWPPRRAAEGEATLFLGYPGVHREIMEGGVVNHIAVWRDFVVSSSNRHFIVADEEGQRVVHEYTPGLAELGPTGGMSGAPVFAEREGQLVLVGVNHEADDGTAATFFATHCDFVRADGTIDRTRPM